MVLDHRRLEFSKFGVADLLEKGAEKVDSSRYLFHANPKATAAVNEGSVDVVVLAPRFPNWAQEEVLKRTK